MARLQQALARKAELEAELAAVQAEREAAGGAALRKLYDERVAVLQRRVQMHQRQCDRIAAEEAPLDAQVAQWVADIEADFPGVYTEALGRLRCRCATDPFWQAYAEAVAGGVRETFLARFLR